MRKFFIIAVCLAMSGVLKAQGLTRYGQSTETSSDFIDKNGKVQSAARLDKNGQTSEAYNHTIVIDGINDFIAADEQFPTTSSGYLAYFSWDADYFYIGYKGADINSGSASRWLIIYLDGTPGTTTGITLNTQTPSLPFSAKYLVFWKASGDYLGVRKYDGSAWAISSFVSVSDLYKINDYFELKISRAAIDNPSKLKIHVHMINEQGGAEWSYGGVPSNSFSDGYDPNFLHNYYFDLSGSKKPNEYASQ